MFWGLAGGRAMPAWRVNGQGGRGSAMVRARPSLLVLFERLDRYPCGWASGRGEKRPWRRKGELREVLEADASARS